jgi:hypothetical protein
MRVPQRTSSRPAGSADEANSAESRMSVAAIRWWLVGIALCGFVVFGLVFLMGHASPGVWGFVAHLVLALSLSFVFAVLGAFFLGIAVSKATEPYWLIALVLGGVAVFWLVLLVEHADPGESAGPGDTGWFADKALAFGFSVGFVFVQTMIVMLTILAPAGSPQTKRRSLGQVGPVLEELEKVRMLAQKRAVPFRLLVSPIGFGAAFALGHLVAVLIGYDPVPVEFLSTLLGGSLGYAIGGLREGGFYARLYKARVLPMLIGTSNELHYQKPPKAPLQPLQALFRCDALKGDDALVGAYRGLPVVVAQVRALRGALAVFDGLVVEVTLRNRLSGDTAIVPTPSTGQPHWVTPHGLERVGLEDPVFERAYDVYSSDQVMARALLTPEFMERLRGFGGRFGQPLCLGHANQLFVALPTLRQVFTPPVFDDSASSPDEVTQLKADFAGILGVIDSVIDLDSQTRDAAPLPAPPQPSDPQVPRRRSRQS